MCGIVGAFQSEPLPAELVRSVLDSLAHRGPDDEGLEETGGFLLAMRRLSIIDVTGGAQPVTSADGRVSLIQNGEIYNYKELREELSQRGHTFRTASDTEVALALYLEHGDDFVEHLRGMFAIAIADRRRRRLLLVRDRFGQKPLYYSRPKPETLVFASELKALVPLLEHLGGPPSIRSQAIYDYLSLGVVPQPETVYEGVFAVDPGSRLVFDGDSLVQETYWSPVFSPKIRSSYKDAQAEVRRLLAEAVRLRLRSDVPVGVFLSGGVDSSVVAYEAARQAERPLRLFTVAMGDPQLDESPMAQATAERLGLETTVLPLDYAPVDELTSLVSHYDQPYADSSAIPSMAVSRLAAAEVKVVLNGDGGDEIFAGYRRHVAARYGRRLGWVPRFVLRAASGALERADFGRRSRLGFLTRFLRGRGRTAGGRYLAWTTDLFHQEDKRSCWRGPPAIATEARIEERIGSDLAGLDQLLAADLELNFLSDLLVKMDMATMACSLEARSPFLDHHLAQYVCRLPESFKTKGLTPKRLLRDAYSAHLAPEVVRAPKRGFEVPMARWLAEDFRDLLGDTLGQPRALVREYVDGALLDGVLTGRSLSERNRPQLVYALLVLELWLRHRGAKT